MICMRAYTYSILKASICTYKPVNAKFYKDKKALIRPDALIKVVKTNLESTFYHYSLGLFDVTN